MTKTLSETNWSQGLKKVLAVFALLLSTFALSQADRNSALYNLDQGIGLKGYDPVSYFAEGGMSPLKGSASFELEFKGVIYHFANQENLETFQTMPERYEPTFGGWCAWAMANGSRVDINPTIFTVNGNRLHFFISKRAKRNFDRDIAKYERKADDNWRAISGEEPRL